MGERLVVAAEVKNLAPVRRYVEEWALAQQAEQSAIDDLVMAVDETITNIIVHGYQNRPGEIQIFLDLEDGLMVIRIRDQAPLFDPTTVPPPDLTLPLEARMDGGLGIFLSRKFVDSYTYRVTPQSENELMLRKRLTSK